ncbi:MAG: GNAT family N-acetyltransferase [Actinobacteria bacterium]|nr:GNAT family N-acetyltransferase [Actinomycetota bacterium]
MSLHHCFVAANKTQQDLSNFDCGKAEMNMFIGRFACKHMGLGLSTTWVLPDTPEGLIPGNGNLAPIAAYFTLAQNTVDKESLPVKQSLPRYPIPTVLLARLAVDKKYQGQGIGGKALVTSLRKACELCDMGLPAYGLVLDVLDDNAMGFYQSYGLFHPLHDNPKRLFVGMKTIRKI